MKIINEYKIKNGVTAEDIKKELREKHLRISVGHCSYIHPDGVFSTGKCLADEISVNICFPKNLSTWDSYDHVIVLDEDFGQPYTPFYDLEEKAEKYPNKPINRYALNVAGNYNKFMNSLSFLERKE